MPLQRQATEHYSNYKKSMIKQNPFSIYDFLGYFIPGALVIYIFLLLITVSDFTNINNVITILSSNKSFQLDSFLFFVIISYSLGHLISFLSSITIERYSNWKYNYPSKYLMNLKPNHKFWIGTKKIIIWKIILLILILPVSVFDYIFGEFLNFKAFYTKKADNYIIETVKFKGLILLNQLGTPITKTLREYDFHRIFSHYVYENTKNHQSRLTNYVALYGFLRALCLISVLFFWLLTYKLYKKVFLIKTIDEYFKHNKLILLVFILTSIASYIFFMAFMKFYRRYTLESLMLIVIDKELVDNKRKRKRMEE